MVVGNHVGISVLWFVDLEVGVLPRELLTGVDGLRSRGKFVIASVLYYANFYLVN